MKRLKMIKTKAVLLTVLLTFSGCASLNPLDIVKPKPNIEAQANIGQNVDVENEENVMKVENGNTEQNAETITNTEVANTTADTIENITNNVPIEVLLILCVFAGWAIPDPRKTFEGIVAGIKGTYNGIKFVIGDIFGGIFKLFGKEL